MEPTEVCFGGSADKEGGRRLEGNASGVEEEVCFEWCSFSKCQWPGYVVVLLVCIHVSLAFVAILHFHRQHLLRRCP